jgi:cobalt-zinc-cadmium efflux system membrane fusion protein
MCLPRSGATAEPGQTHRSAPTFILLCLLVASLSLAAGCSSGGAKSGEKPAAEPKAEAREEHDESGKVELSEEALKAAKIETVAVIEQAADETLRVTGSVETNQQQTQQATPLVSGRVERVHAALGDRVRKGAVLAMIASPQIAEMHGKLHEAETALAIAERNYERVQKSENRVAVLQAKARLDEAEASLRRTERLIELGAGAGKDLVAAEAAYKTAKAEYEFQSNIALNKELAEARAAVDTARVDVRHMRDQLAALGAPVAAGEKDDDHSHDTSLIALRSPIAGTVTERLVNAGAGIEAGKPLFTVANISNLWVIANVPEAQVKTLRTGAAAQVRAADGEEIAGRVTYIDPLLNEETRTARVRVEIANPGGRLKVGAFVEVGFNSNAAGGEMGLAIPDEAVQRIGDRTVVFVPKEGEAGHFEVRDVEAGGVSSGRRRIINGLKTGERVVTRGSFALKTQLMKGELGEDEH